MKQTIVTQFEEKYLALLARIDCDERRLSEGGYPSPLRICFESPTNFGLFQALIFEDKLRFHAVFDQDVQSSMASVIAQKIRDVQKTCSLPTGFIWCWQGNPTLAHCLQQESHMQQEPYQSMEYLYERKNIPAQAPIIPLLIKPYDESLLDGILSLLEDAFVPLLSAHGDFTKNREEMAEKFSRTTDARFEAFYDQEELVGFYFHKHGEIDFIAIAPKHQRKGYGSMILKRALYAISCDSTLQPRLYCASKNKNALAFYAKNGWLVVGASIGIRWKEPS